MSSGAHTLGTIAATHAKNHAYRRRYEHRDDQRRGITQMNGGNANQQANAIRDEPDQPHANAELVEALTALLVATEKDEGRPDGVEEHEDDGERTGNRVERGTRAMRGTRDGSHDGRARRVARKTDQKQDEMLLLQ